MTVQYMTVSYSASHKWNFCILPLSTSPRLRKHCRTGGRMVVKTRGWEGKQKPVFGPWQDHCKHKFTAVVAAKTSTRSSQSSFQYRLIRCPSPYPSEYVFTVDDSHRIAFSSGHSPWKTAIFLWMAYTHGSMRSTNWKLWVNR